MDAILKHKGKIITLIVAGLTALGLAISPELGNVIAEGLDAVEQVVRGISEAPVEVAPEIAEEITSP